MDKKEYSKAFDLINDNSRSVSPSSRNVYVGDTFNHRIQYFTRGGSYLGQWGALGTGNGQFQSPSGLCSNVTGSRVYVADSSNQRIQYFNRNEAAAAPASLGRVKALFR